MRDQESIVRLDRRRQSHFVGISSAVVLDVETSGLNPWRDRIVSIAMIQINFKYLLEYGIAMYENTYEGKFNPLVRIRASASRIHGIRNEDVIDCPTFKEAAHSVREFIRDRSIVGHNVNFDKQFLSSEFRRCGVESVDRNGAFCTMSRVRELRGQAGGWLVLQ